MDNEVFKTAPDSEWNDPIQRNLFIEKVSDFAFGDCTIERGYTMTEVLARLEKFCEFSHKWEEYSGEESC